MKASANWSYHPYQPPLRENGDIYICRIAPSAHSVHVEWLDIGCSSYTILYKKTSDTVTRELLVTNTCECDISNLETEQEYEITIQAVQKRSRTRLVRTADAVGTVVNYLHPKDDAYSFSGHYLCSPSLLRHPDGYLLAAMDVFDHYTPQNLELIFRSDDNGKTWHYVSELYPCFWGRLFLHNNKLYMIGCSTEYGDLLIGRSDDGGKTFSAPTALLRGACKSDRAGVHKNSQPPLTYAGRVWLTMEWGSWALGSHAAMVASFPEDADPLDAAAWRFSEPVPYNPSWPGTANGPSSGTIEGTLAVLPDRKLYNIMRYDMSKAIPNSGKVLAYLVNTENPEAPLTYDHAIALPGNHSKFMIRYDDVSDYYYTMICRITDSNLPLDRRLLSLMKSKDCKTWELVSDVIDGREEDSYKVGFQYPDFFIEGEDILFLCRTAINDSHTYHDNNYSTFHRIKNFRKL